jgi:transposase-like protein
MAKTRRNHSTEFKAQVLAELSQLTVAQLAEKHQINQSNIRNWMRAAGMDTGKGRAKRNRDEPNERQAAALLAMANRGDKTVKQVAAELKTSPKTLRELVKYFGLPKTANGAANGATNGVHAIRNGAAVNPLLAITEAKRQLSGIIEQLDALSGAFQAFQAVFGIQPVTSSASVTS